MESHFLARGRTPDGLTFDEICIHFAEGRITLLQATNYLNGLEPGQQSHNRLILKAIGIFGIARSGPNWISIATGKDSKKFVGGAA